MRKYRANELRKWADGLKSTDDGHNYEARRLDYEALNAQLHEFAAPALRSRQFTQYPRLEGEQEFEQNGANQGVAAQFSSRQSVKYTLTLGWLQI